MVTETVMFEMNNNILKGILFRQFPKSIGFILTGSQSGNTVFTTASDIDVMIFDTMNSGIYSRGLIQDHYKIDCTVVPIFDIENVIINEYFDLKGTFLNMLASGVILNDPHKIILEIKQSITPLINRRSNALTQHYKKLVEELLKMRKYFERDLNEQERIFLLCDFVHLISKIEVIKSSGWDAINLRKTKLLNETNKGFVEKIIKLHKKGLEVEDLQFLIGYIDNYHKNLIQSADYKPPTIVFDISIADFSLQQFSLKVVPSIISNEILSRCYRYFYISPKKYYRQYKYDLSLCFNIQEDINIVDVINELSGLINSSKGEKAFRYEIIEPLEKVSDSHFSNIIQDFRVSLCTLATALILKEKEIKAKPVDIGLALCCALQQLLLLGIEDTGYLNTFLMQKWLFTYPEEKNAKEHRYLITAGKEKQKNWDIQFEACKANILSIIEQGINENKLDLNEEVHQLYLQLINKLKKISQNINLRTNYLPDSLIKYLHLTKPEEGRLYLILTEEILKMLNIRDDDKAFCLYAMSKGAMELFFA